MKHNEMAFREAPVVFTCCGEEVSGIIHQAENPIGLGVLLVVGGPQYRVGSHRQFVLLARFLAENGVTVFRFDYRGMGDSTGLIQDFEQANADIKAAVGFFLSEVKNVQRLILWGLCDAASASCFYAAKEERVQGLVLLNPWVRTEQGESEVFLKDYYLKRFCSWGFWQKILSGKVDYKSSMVSLNEKLVGVFKKRSLIVDETTQPLSLPERLLISLERFKCPVLFILSGKDLTAKEFSRLVDTDIKGQVLMKRANVTQIDLPESDHTFSSEEWKSKVNMETLNWLKAL